MNSLLSKIIADNKNVIICLALVALAGYAIILPTSFKTMDDLVSIVNNPRIKNITRLGEIFSTSFFTEKAYYRPLVLVSFMVEYHLFGLKAFFYNLTNVLLHVTNGVLAFHIVQQLLKNRRVAFFSALVYVIHPVHWEAVSNIPGRSILLCSLFFLLSFYWFLRSEEKPSGGKDMLAVGSFILALLSKESAVMLPFCLGAYYFLIKSAFDRRALRILLPYGFLLIGYFVLRHALGITSVTPWTGPMEMFLGVSTFLRVCLYYVQQIILPINFYYDHTSVLFTRVGDPLLWLVWLIWGGALTAIVFFRKRIPAELVYFFAWIVLTLATVSQIVPLRSPGGRVSTADHFLYLPLLGAVAILVYAADRFLIRTDSLKPVIKNVLVGGFLMYLFLVLLQHNFYSSNQIAMFKRALEHDPGNTRVRNSLAVIYGYAGKYAEAEFHYSEAIKGDPHNTHALIGLGQALADQGRYEAALEQYAQVRDPRAFLGRHRQNLIYAHEQLIEQLQARGEQTRAAELQERLSQIKATND